MHDEVTVEEVNSLKHLANYVFDMLLFENDIGISDDVC